LQRIIWLGLFVAWGAALNAQENSGKIVFYREPHALTGNFKPAIFCDGEELARIENGTYFEITATAGPHTCVTESPQGPDAIEVNVIVGKPAYVHVKLVPGWTQEHSTLANTTENEYDKQKARLKPLSEWRRPPRGPHPSDNVAALAPHSAPD
jgi:hypothetical protein